MQVTVFADPAGKKQECVLFLGVTITRYFSCFFA